MHANSAVNGLRPFKVTFGEYRDLLKKYLRPQSGRVLLLGLLLFIGIGLQLANPQIIRYFIDTASSGAPRDALVSAALLFITLSLLQKGVALVGEMFAQDVGWNATNALRR